MGRCYGQLSLEQRVRYTAGGISQNQIAAALGRSPPMISRELRRNSKRRKALAGGYEPIRAHQLAGDGGSKGMAQPAWQHSGGFSPEHRVRITTKQFA
ncbi:MULTISPECIES: helix-turn-helix domain-containing protein [Bradyrhizobium]|uniref:helix-turn-helix domain-containing protein n=1 Tax=Bradyrhizobium TaxID=374 RepID=UPI0035147AD2